MALSSMSVVYSSLGLRSRIPSIGFKARREKGIVSDEGVRYDAAQIV
jgi:hypothetical protein